MENQRQLNPDVAVARAAPLSISRAHAMTGETFLLGHFIPNPLLLANGLSESIKRSAFLQCNPEMYHIFLSIKSLSLVN